MLHNRVPPATLGILRSLAVRWWTVVDKVELGSHSSSIQYRD